MYSLPFNEIYRQKKVLLTGNTGFKGSWLTIWLSELQAHVVGYSLSPPTDPSLFETLKLHVLTNQIDGDVRDLDHLVTVVKETRPDIIFHLAAQSLVRESYSKPFETISINTLGSVNLLEAVRIAGINCAVVMVTTDKCYENKEWEYGYRETDPLGGYDPYSASKGAAEILINSYRNSFFNVDEISHHGVRIATVRAGNVIGGGDWAKDRIVPDCIRDINRDGIIGVRNPLATRPWQHVLEPLHGYLTLGAKLLEYPGDVAQYCEAFNFGPRVDSNRSVQDLVDKIIEYWGSGMWKNFSPEVPRHEASLLNLSIDKAFHKLGWQPRWNFDATVRYTVEWYARLESSPYDMLDFSCRQIKAYQENSLLAGIASSDLIH